MSEYCTDCVWRLSAFKHCSVNPDSTSVWKFVRSAGYCWVNPSVVNPYTAARGQKAAREAISLRIAEIEESLKLFKYLHDVRYKNSYHGLNAEQEYLVDLLKSMR